MLLNISLEIEAFVKIRIEAEAPFIIFCRLLRSAFDSMEMPPDQITVSKIGMLLTRLIKQSPSFRSFFIRRFFLPGSQPDPSPKDQSPGMIEVAFPLAQHPFARATSFLQLMTLKKDLCPEEMRRLHFRTIEQSSPEIEERLLNPTLL